jgi:hypothetical protein
MIRKNDKLFFREHHASLRRRQSDSVARERDIDRKPAVAYYRPRSRFFMRRSSADLVR